MVTVVTNGVVSSLLAEPAVDDPPRRAGRDRVLLAAVAVAALIEAVARTDLVWGPWPLLVVPVVATTLLWRRRRPLEMTAIAMTTFIVLDQVAFAIDDAPFSAYSSAFVLVHIYALFRWGSGRHCAWGIVVMIAAFVSSSVTDWTGAGDAVGGAVVLAFTALLGAEVRHFGQRRDRLRVEVKQRERELLARELHDTVAHHVSAIAIRAQAGQVVAATEPGAAIDALAVIETEASRTLAEMRSIVGTLRDRDDAGGPDWTPTPTASDVAGLADASTTGLRVDVDLAGANDVGPTVGAALFRVAQEAVTNARRHAIDATAISIDLVVENDAARLRVVDDGAGARKPLHPNGYGLIGMIERVELLGGTLRAGPNGDRGWRVDATIPLGANR